MPVKSAVTAPPIGKTKRISGVITCKWPGTLTQRVQEAYLNKQCIVELLLQTPCTAILARPHCDVLLDLQSAEYDRSVRRADDEPCC